MARSNSKTRFRFKLVVTGIATVLLLIGLNYWTFVRPTSVSQRFIRLVLNGQFEKSADMLAGLSELAADEKLLHWTAHDGSTVDIPIRKAEFNVLEDPSRPQRFGFIDYLLSRKHFQICAIWDDEVGSHVEPIYCTTQGSRVVINHVGKIDE